jgi:hypothetical protein
MRAPDIGSRAIEPGKPYRSSLASKESAGVSGVREITAVLQRFEARPILSADRGSTETMKRTGSWLGGFLWISFCCFGCQSSQDHSRVSVRQSDCLVCHQADRELALDPPHDTFPSECGTCHGNEAWSPASFMHPWPLTGAHEASACVACHVGEPPVYAGTPTQCVGCHRDDYDRSTFPGHADFPTSCENCHTTMAWTPAMGGNHPENAFPIQNGPHSRYRNDCVSCHDPNLGSPVNGENTDCVGCHDGEHTRGRMDPKHDEVGGYPRGDAPPNFCLECHSDGRNTDD